MKRQIAGSVLILLLTLGISDPLRADEALPGPSLVSLLDYARNNNPDYAAMRYEAVAAEERITPAGALPDPKFRAELRDITRMGEQNATLSPSRVGSTRYLLMQDLPWYGKRDLETGHRRTRSRSGTRPGSRNLGRVIGQAQGRACPALFVQQTRS